MANEMIKENAWAKVKLGNTSGYQMTSYAVSSSWFNQHTQNAGDHLSRLRRYHEADSNSVEIARALDIMAEDISSCNADDDETFIINYPDEEKMKKGTLRLMGDMLDLWNERTEMEKRLFDRVRYVLKYGFGAWQKNTDGSLTKLNTERFIGYILSPEDENVVTHYIYNPKAELIESSNKRNYMHDIGGNRQTAYQTIPVNELLILKIGEKPFGESVIERVYSTWKKLSMLEDAIVIYRVVRAPERRIYYIDTGNLQGPKRKAAIEQQRLRLMQKNASRNGDLTTDYDPHSTSEDIFIPTNSQGKGSRVETLPAGQALGEVNDLAWFHRQLAAGLRIPFSMIDVAGQDSGRDQYSDMRVGQVYQVEIRYMGYIRRHQRNFSETLHHNFVEFCLDREVVPPEVAKLEISPPNSFSLYKEMEVNQTMLNVYSSTLQIQSLSKRTAMQKYLNFDHEEIVENEYQMLREKGLTDEQIKEIPDNVKDNIVYGDGRLGADFGIEPSMGRF